jgi:hypothetical protein
MARVQNGMAGVRLAEAIPGLTKANDWGLNYWFISAASPPLLPGSSRRKVGRLGNRKYERDLDL